MKEKPNKKSLKDGLRSSREFIKYTNIAFRMIIIILVGVYSGVKLDEYLKMESSIFTMIFSLLAVIVAMYVIIKEITSR